MINEIFPGVFSLDIPIPQNPLKSLNSYVIMGDERNLVIDTGMNRNECLEAMRDGFARLRLDLSRTDFFITHMHADHSGLAAVLAGKGSVVYCSRQDGEIINAKEEIWERMREFVRLGGFPASEFWEAIHHHPGYKYRALGHLYYTAIKDGDIINTGSYRFRCVETPGHTRGHVCLYEEARKLLVSGDHVLGDITPNISLWSDDEDPLNDYLASLDKVGELDVRLTLPGHRSLIYDLGQRIEELKCHHRNRADEALSILEQGARTAFDVASQMTWDLTYRCFDDFPIAQKWFAAGEALAHLKFLEGKGLINRELQNDVFVFSLCHGGG